jgi:uncharacterized membrane protein (UPF0127 family)
VSRLRIINQTRGALLADGAEIADTSRKRRTGLLKHISLEAGEGLWIVPCEAVHTIGMKFAIDVLFLDKRRRVLKVRQGMGKWRMAACLRAHSVLELPAGTTERTGTGVGDQLEFEKIG